MDVPEIRLLIGFYLGDCRESSTLHTLASCVRVCKEWNETFIPLLYGDFYTIQFTKCTIGMRLSNSINAGLRRHGYHTSKLSVALPYPHLDALATSTGNIKKLSIVECEIIDMDEHTLGDHHGLGTLLAKNSGIEHLELECFRGTKSSRYIALIVQCCRQLRFFNVTGSVFDLADLVSLDGFSHLSTIRFFNCNIVATGGPLIRAPYLPSLIRFDLSWCVEVQAVLAAVNIFSNYPDLKKLNLEFMNHEGAWPETHHPLWKFQVAQQISDLELGIIDLTDQDLARVLDSYLDLEKAQPP